MQVCTSLQTDNHTSTPPLLCFLQAGCPSCRPTNSVKALKAAYKLKWVPPDNHSEVSQAFVEAVTMMDTPSTTVAESTSSQLIAGLEGDDVYGYGENNCSSSAVASSTSQVKAEAMNFLSDADKSLSRLHFFPAVQRLLLKFNTALPSSAPVCDFLVLRG